METDARQVLLQERLKRVQIALERIKEKVAPLFPTGLRVRCSVASGPLDIVGRCDLSEVIPAKDLGWLARLTGGVACGHSQIPIVTIYLGNPGMTVTVSNERIKNVVQDELAYLDQEE